MKKQLFILAVFISNSYFSIGQVLHFPQPGMQQIYSSWSLPSFNYSSYKYLNDTLINGINMNKFMIITISSGASGYYKGFVYTYSLVAQGKIFVALADTFGNLTGGGYDKYNFTLNIGDTTSYDSCAVFSTQWPVIGIVDSVGLFMTQNSQLRKKLFVTDMFQPYNSHEWIDGIGHKILSFFGNCSWIDSYNDLICHYDSSGLVFSDGTNLCDSLKIAFDGIYYSIIGGTYISDDTEPTEKLDVFPNPSTGIVTITAKKGDEIIIRDLTGRKIKTIKNFQGKINFSSDEFDGGIYFIILYQNHRVISTSKLIIAK